MRGRVFVALLAVLSIGLGAATASAAGGTEPAPSEATPVNKDRAAIHDAAVAIESDARKRWPDSFAGTWLSEDLSSAEVFVAFSSNAEAHVAEIAKDFPRPDLLVAVDAKRSLSELEAELDQLDADRSAAAEGKSTLPGAEDGDYGLGIDIARNAPVVYVEKLTPEVSEGVQERYGDGVLVKEQPPAQPQACNSRSDCFYTLRGGLISSGSDLCSTGFVVRGANGARKILSAAHCGGGDIGSARKTGGDIGVPLVKYGSVTDQAQYGRVDVEVHSIDAPFDAMPWVYKGAFNKDWEIRQTEIWSNLISGETVCMASIWAGGPDTYPEPNCGKIKDKYFSPFAGTERYVKTSLCSMQGDSGGAVFGDDSEGTGHRALGIHAAGSFSNEDCGPTHWAAFTAINYDTNALGVTVDLAP